MCTMSCCRRCRSANPGSVTNRDGRSLAEVPCTLGPPGIHTFAAKAAVPVSEHLATCPEPSAPPAPHPAQRCPCTQPSRRHPAAASSRPQTCSSAARRASLRARGGTSGCELAPPPQPPCAPCAASAPAAASPHSPTTIFKYQCSNVMSFLNV